MQTKSEREHHTCNSQPKVSLSFVNMTGRTRLSVGIFETRENKNIAASNDPKKIRAPAKKKFPMLQSDKSLLLFILLL